MGSPARFRYGPLEIEVYSDLPQVIEILRYDFAAFDLLNSRGDFPACLIPKRATLLLSTLPPQASAEGEMTLRFRSARFSGQGKRRRVVYEDGAAVLIDDQLLTAAVHAATPERLHELAYLWILYQWGRWMDQRGVHRVHALGFVRSGRGYLLPMDSGQGKTSLARANAAATRLPLLGEELVIACVEDSVPRLYPFPLRIAVNAADAQGPHFKREGFGSKSLLPWSEIAELARPAHAEAVISTRGPALVAILKHLVIGIGVPQMLEFYLRLGVIGLMEQAVNWVSRLDLMLRLVFHARSVDLPRSWDPATDWERVVRQSAVVDS